MKDFILKTLAIMTVIILLMTFLCGVQLQELLLRAPFMKIDPFFSGGEVERTIESGAYTVNIHEKVFPALIGEGDEGFRQITIVKNDSTLTTFNMNVFAVDSQTTVQIEGNTPIVCKGAQKDTIREVGLSEKKLIFRIEEKK